MAEFQHDETDQNNPTEEQNVSDQTTWHRLLRPHPFLATSLDKAWYSQILPPSRMCQHAPAIFWPCRPENPKGRSVVCELLAFAESCRIDKRHVLLFREFGRKKSRSGGNLKRGT